MRLCVNHECVQFLERVYQVQQRPPPTIESPDQDEIDLLLPGSIASKQCLWEIAFVY